MTVLGSLEIDGLRKIELLDDDTRAKIKVVKNDLNELVGVALRCAIRVNVDRQRLSDTNGVRELDKGTAGQASSDERLCDPAAKVSGRTIDLGEILAGEGTTAVSTPATVSVDDDLATSQTGITLGTANDKEAGGLDVVDCLVIKVLGGNGSLDDLLQDLLAEFLGGYVGTMLCRHDDGVDAQGNNGTVIMLILNRDLGFGVGT